MNFGVNIYVIKNKGESFVKYSLKIDNSIELSENDYIYFEIFSTDLIDSDVFVWLSDFRFNLSYSHKEDSLWFYSLSLDDFFSNEDKYKFTINAVINNISRCFSKIFLNYYGSCNLEIDDVSQNNKIVPIGLLNIHSEKISEIDYILDFLMEQQYAFWNSISLTKINANSADKYSENILWSLKKLVDSTESIMRNFIPFLYDSLTKLIPKTYIDVTGKTDNASEESLLWLINNSNVLETSNYYSLNSFLIQNRYYTAKELLVEELFESTDVSENQVIHGYINDLTSFASDISSKIDLQLDNYLERDSFKSRIIISYYKRLKTNLLQLQKSLSKINHSIHQFIPVSKTHLDLSICNSFPSKPHYYNIYLEILKWLKKEDAIFSTEEIFYGANDIAKLYEKFCLFKLVSCLSNDFKFQVRVKEKDKINEEMYNIGLETNSFYSKYSFESYSSPYKVNLYYERLPDELTTIANKARAGYRPDFILQIEFEGQKTYLIFDAKYKKIKSVEDFDYKELSLKYLHGIGLKSGGAFRASALMILNPIDDSGMDFYQRNDFSLDLSLQYLPLIGRLEVGTKPNSANTLKHFLSKFL